MQPNSLLPSLRPDPASWRAEAACRHADPSLFFPDDCNTSTDQAKALCAVCPVQPECLEHALTFPERYGTWAGYGQNELNRMRRARRRRERGVEIEHGTTAGRKAHYDTGTLPVCEPCLRAWNDWRRGWRDQPN